MVSTSELPGRLCKLQSSAVEIPFHVPGSRFRSRLMGCSFWSYACLLTLVSHFLVVSALTHPRDADALGFLGESWNNKPPSWTGSDPCGSQWDGISCTGSRITSITLSSTGLQGELSGDIGSLTELETLDLSYNVNLTGPLPQSIGSLTNLKRL